jgi:hypothetical protein
MLLALAVGILAAAAVLFVTSGPVRLSPWSALWQRFARGTPAGGRLREPLVLPLPSLRRDAPARVAVLARAATPRGAPLGISIDGDPASRVDLVPGEREWLALPVRAQDGGEVALLPASPVVLDGVEIVPRPEVRSAIVALLAVALLTFAMLATRPPASALGLGVLAAGAIALGCVPAWIVLGWPGAGSVGRLAAPAALAAAGLIAALRARPDRPTARLALLIMAGLLGCWLRAFLLPSTGSWDVDYWRTAMRRASALGLGNAYGGSDDVAPGHFLAQLTGREEVSAPVVLDRAIVVNYPPLAVALWTASWEWVRRHASRLEPLEAEALATKLPSLAGDLAAVAVLLWIHRSRPWRAATLAALYWATPVSWLNSAAQGYQDGAYAPLLVLSLMAAASGRSLAAGTLLGAAAMIKLPAVLIAPAVAGALVAGRARLLPAALGGLVVIALAFLPFAAAGTLPSAVVHVNSLLLPGPASGGAPNVWWLAGHVANVLRGRSAMGDAVSWVHSNALPVPAHALGRALWAAAAVATFLRQRRRPGLRPALLAAATLVFSYGVLATGVYENHVHPLFLLLLAAGLETRRERVIAAAAAVVYVLDVLMLSGLGRFYTMRYALVAPLTPDWQALRMAMGFDFTLVLSAANVVLLAAWWWGLDRRMARDDETAYRASPAVA